MNTIKNQVKLTVHAFRVTEVKYCRQNSCVRECTDAFIQYNLKHMICILNKNISVMINDTKIHTT